MNPKSLKISNIHCRYNGDVVIDCCSDDESERTKPVIENKMSKAYEIIVRNKLNPGSKLSDISFNYGNEKLLDKRRSQNPIWDESTLGVARSYSVTKPGKTVIAVGCAYFHKIMAEGKLCVG